MVETICHNGICSHLNVAQLLLIVLQKEKLCLAPHIHICMYVCVYVIQGCVHRFHLFSGSLWDLLTLSMNKSFLCVLQLRISVVQTADVH